MVSGLDSTTGLDLSQLRTQWEQIPLDTQPLNLDEVNAVGKAGAWLYPDKLIPTLTRVQARDRTQSGQAQDVSTDGKRNLNVNLAAADIAIGGGGSMAPTRSYELNGDGHMNTLNLTTGKIDRLWEIHGFVNLRKDPSYGSQNCLIAFRDDDALTRYVILQAQGEFADYVSPPDFIHYDIALIYPGGLPIGAFMNSGANTYFTIDGQTSTWGDAGFTFSVS